MEILVLIFGLFIGSFLNVVVLRLHDGGSPFVGRSECPHCKKTLSWYELIPVLSFVFLRAKCRKCGKAISWQYPFVELATGLSFAGLAFVFSDLTELAFYMVLTCFLILVFVYDARWQLIPDHFIMPAFVIAVIGGWLLRADMLDMLYGVFIGAGFFLVQFLVSRGTWVGGGDIRLGGLMGAILGFQGVIAALFFAYIIGALVAIVLLSMKKATRKTKLAFGTFLTLATYAVIVFETQVQHWFESIFLW